MPLNKTMKLRGAKRVKTRKTYKSDKDIGFIVLRHVNSKETNLYWQESYDCIRKFYPESKIVIIDDNSDPNYVTERVLYKTDIIQSEFPGRGELLPYYYYARHNWFPTAVVLHDGVFINKHIDFKVNKYKIIWEFNHYWDKPKNEIRLIKALKNHDDLLELHADKSAWKGCFGAMSVITHEFVKMLDDKYDLARLLPLITTRKNRQTFERVFACLLQANHKKEVLMGFVLKTTKWGYPFYKYIKEYDNEYMKSPLIKVWTGR